MQFYRERADGILSKRDDNLWSDTLNYSDELAEHWNRLLPPPRDSRRVFDNFMKGDSEELLRSIKNSSSPGMDLMYEYPRNGCLLGKNPGLLVDLVRMRVDKRIALARELFPGGVPFDMGRHVPKTNESTAEVFISEGLKDPIKLMIKGEWTKKAKQGRIVASVSLVDSAVDRLVHLADFDNAKRFCYTSPSTIGISVNDPKLMCVLYADTQRSFTFPDGDVASSDVSSFENSYDEISRFRQAKIDARRLLGTSDFSKLDMSDNFTALFIGNLICDLSPTWLVTSNGDVIYDPNITMKSGEFKTAMYDTRERASLPTLAAKFHEKLHGKVHPWSNLGFVPAKANGDDCLENKPKDVTNEELTETYAKFGFKLTDLNTDRIDKHGARVFEFCSSAISETTSYPENIVKTTLSLLSHKAVSEELWDQFRCLNCHRPNWREEEQLILSVAEPRPLADSEG